MGSKTIGTTLFAAVLTLALAVPASAATTRSGLYRFADGSPVSGASSVLTTTDTGARFQLQTNDLPSGDRVNVLWVIFNQPQNCTHGGPGHRCGPGDLPPYGGDDSAVTSIVADNGHPVGGSGNATFAGRLATGDTSNALFGPGLINPTGAEVHLLVADADGTILQFSPHEQ